MSETSKDLIDSLSKRIFNELFQVETAQQLLFDEIVENDFSTLTAKEIIGKVRAFIKNKPHDVDYWIFLNYLANYPVSMCKRDMSPRLKTLIGFHYRLGVPDESHSPLIEKVSYDDLSRVFERSKASISVAVDQTSMTWHEFQDAVEKQKFIDDQIRQVAERELIEEKKKLMLASNEKNSEQLDK